MRFDANRCFEMRKKGFEVWLHAQHWCNVPLFRSFDSLPGPKRWRQQSLHQLSWVAYQPASTQRYERAKIPIWTWTSHFLILLDWSFLFPGVENFPQRCQIHSNYLPWGLPSLGDYLLYRTFGKIVLGALQCFTANNCCAFASSREFAVWCDAEKIEGGFRSFEFFCSAWIRKSIKLFVG